MRKYKKDPPCPFCAADKVFKQLNPETWEYSGIELTISDDLIRVRSYPNGSNNNFTNMEVVKINYCPMCGRKLGENDSV